MQLSLTEGQYPAISAQALGQSITLRQPQTLGYQASPQCGHRPMALETELPLSWFQIMRPASIRTAPHSANTR